MFIMPQACISCRRYRHKGYAEDKHSNLYDAPLKEARKRQQYGTCSLHQAEVFASEICEQYRPEEGIGVTPVSNRPEPKHPRQDRLF